MSTPPLTRRIARRILSPIMRRWYAHWNRRTHHVRVDGLELTVSPSVFHPTWFTSTGLLAEEVRSHPLQGTTFLDLGTGAGRIALTAARAGAIVTASDVNPAAVACARSNAARNQLSITAVTSDLFDRIVGDFDLIAINPPYYPHPPGSASEHAFFSGSDHAYFQRLFPALGPRIQRGGRVIMVLSEDLDLKILHGLAVACGMRLTPLRSTKRWGERTTVFELVRSDPGGTCG